MEILKENVIIELVQNGEVIMTGDIYDVREQVETIIEDKLKVFVSLQEIVDVEEGLYQVAVHTDAYEDCTKDEIDVFSDFGLSEDAESTTLAISEKLAIQFQIQ